MEEEHKPTDQGSKPTDHSGDSPAQTKQGREGEDRSCSICGERIQKDEDEAFQGVCPRCAYKRMMG